MKCFIVLPVALAASAACAQTIKIDWALYEVGGVVPLSRYTSQTNCQTGARLTNQPKKYRCDQELTVTPTCVAPKPPNDTQPGVCPTGQTVVNPWTQTRSYVTAPYPTCWVAGTVWTPTTPPTGACAIVPTTWSFLANEGASFSVGSTARTVRYGVGSAWVQKSLTGSGACTNTFFGSDPAQGTAKTCEILGAAPAPAPAPAPRRHQPRRQPRHPRQPPGPSRTG